METNRIPNQAYRLLQNLDAQGKVNWVSKVRITLENTGFNFVWLNQGVGHEKRFLIEFKQRAIDIVKQEWFSGIRDSNRYKTYSSFKSILEPERYFTDVHIKCFRDAIIRFRLGVSDIKVHRNRFIRNPLQGQNDWFFCLGITEDEIHFLMHCPRYSMFRPIIFNAEPYREKELFSLLMSCQEAKKTRQLGWYLHKSFDVRRESLQQLDV